MSCTLEELVDRAKHATCAIAKSFTSHDDEFAPVMLFTSEIFDQTGIAPLDDFLDDENFEDFTMNVLPAFLLGEGISAVCFVLPSWVTEFKSEEEIHEYMTSYTTIQDHPDRSEILRLVGCQADRFVVLSAPVGRDPLQHEPPTLGEFKIILSSETVVNEGEAHSFDQAIHIFSTMFTQTVKALVRVQRLTMAADALTLLVAPHDEEDDSTPGWISMN